MNSNYNLYGYNPYRTNVYAFVNGIEGARAYQMMPNQTVLLMDSDSPLCFMKTSDNMGKANLRCFKLLEVSEQELKGVINNNDNQSYSEQINELNKKIDEIYKIINQKGESE